MFETEFYISRLLKLHQNGDLNSSQLQELEDWLESNPQNRRLYDELMSEETLQAKLSHFSKLDESAGWQKVRQRSLNAQRAPAAVGRISSYVKICSAAAAILLVLGFMFYFFARDPQHEQDQIMARIAEETNPGTGKAILILADGRKVALAGGNETHIVADGNTVVNNTADGGLEYKISNPGFTGHEPEHNTLLTPAGGTYTLTLSDGTKVRLDASSSIYYPVRFMGAERRVILHGQAYFEVSADKKKPFRVESGSQTVEVLGTQFNVNAFSSDKTVTTTLIEGSVKVMNGARSAVLVPGQQAKASGRSRKIEVRPVDVELAVAWKEGYFKFKKADLPTVMEQFSRWYDVEVAYEGEIPNLAVTGRVKRTEEAGQVLKILSQLGVRFKREGKKLIIKEN